MDNAVVIGGLGVVGKATRKMFDIPHYFDLEGSNVTLDRAAKKQFVFIALPTPTNFQSGGYNVSVLYDIIGQLSRMGGGIIVNRSTVMPGTADAMMDKFDIDHIVSNPEFLTMRSIDQDIENPDLVVLGGRNKNCVRAVENLYRDRYMNLPESPGPHYSVGTNKEAEMIKLAINTFYATKVIFANEIYDICQEQEIDYGKVYPAMYRRKWIGENHLDVLYGESRGAKGACLAKDLHAFATGFRKELTLLVDRLNREL